ncbi:FtsK/SpoIIIE family DNA translocase [Woodsholea maritima]|uniref:FtsK/SpoIIIE family DNA translocase n=1 Tax=Woodsholea maritima TaxID=240237 RepID=UPI0003792EE6|nr:DNA translocase FtsK 4TM domain-containing protein [Woodsholea maritima]
MSKAKTTSSSETTSREDTQLVYRPSWIARIWARLAGLLMIALGAAWLGALLSHDPLDPSWNTASVQVVTNWLGGYGAIVSDLSLQIFGWAAGGFALAALGWGLILIYNGPKPRSGGLITLRFSAMVLGVLGFALMVSSLPIPANWPFATGLGGIVGDGLYLGGQGLLTQIGVPGGVFILAGLGLLASLGGFLFTFGLRARDLAAMADAAGRVWATLRVWFDHLMGLLPASWHKGEMVERKPAPDGRAETAPAFLRGEGRAAPAMRTLGRAEPSPDQKIAPQFSSKFSIARGDVPDEDEDAYEDDARVAETIKPAVAAPKKVKPSDREAREAQPGLPFEPTGEGFEMPRLDLLAPAQARADAFDEDALTQNAQLLQSVLSDFGVKGEIVQVRPGPVVTLYELEPAPGVKTSRVINLADDIARSMAAVACRVSVVPGRNAIGIELPNQSRETVFLRALLSSNAFDHAKAALPLALGETIGGEPFCADLARMPHLLIAGTTGSGKSVGINAMILSLLYRLSPEECRMIMIDPKMLELSVYDGIPHLLSPVVVDPKKAVAALKWTVREMESRYLKMSKVGVRNMTGFNEKAALARENGDVLERTVQTGFDKETGQPIYETEIIEPDPMPYIVVVIDEMADLMMVAGKDIEGAVQRLAQMARAAGIHLIMATQRPSVDVITGTIKANFPTRISYQVTSKIDSRTILGEQGAEQLLGMGDLLYMAGGGRIRRLHGPFVSDREVEDVAAFLKAQGTPEYLDDVTLDNDEDSLEALTGVTDETVGNDLFDQAVAIVARDRKASTSYIQRRLQIGYNRAASLIERMEDEGMIGPANHAGKREIFLPEREMN